MIVEQYNLKKTRSVSSLPQKDSKGFGCSKGFIAKSVEENS